MGYLFIIIILSFFWLLLLYSDKFLILSPINIFMSIWLIGLTVLFVFSDFLYPYVEINLETIVVILLLLFLVALFVFVYEVSRKKRLIRRVQTFSPEIQINYKIIARLNIFSLLLSTLFFVNIVSVYGINLMSKSSIIRNAYFASNSSLNLWIGTDYILTFLFAATFLTSAYITTMDPRKLKSQLIIILLPIISALLFSIAYMGRSDFLKVVFTISIAFLINIQKNKVDISAKILRKRKRGVLIYIMISGIVITIISSYLGKGSRYSNNAFISTVLNIAAYASGSIFALDEFLNRNIIYHTLGRESFYPIYRLLGKLPFFTPVDVSYLYDSTSALTGLGVNTYTMFRPMFIDFGYIGMIIIPITLLLMAQKIYFKLLAMKYPKFSYIVFLFSSYPALLFSIQSFEYHNNAYTYGLILAMLIGKSIDLKNKKSILGRKEVN